MAEVCFERQSKRECVCVGVKIKDVDLVQVDEGKTLAKGDSVVSRKKRLLKSRRRSLLERRRLLKSRTRSAAADPCSPNPSVSHVATAIPPSGSHSRWAEEPKCRLPHEPVLHASWLIGDKATKS